MLMCDEATIERYDVCTDSSSPFAGDNKVLVSSYTMPVRKMSMRANVNYGQNMTDVSRRRDISFLFTEIIDIMCDDFIIHNGYKYRVLDVRQNSIGGLCITHVDAEEICAC